MIAAVLNGAAAMACGAIGVFFARFWRESRDRLFFGLSAGFALLAANYAFLGFLAPADERRPFAFLMRLIGLLAVLISILLKDHEYIDPLQDDE